MIGKSELILNSDGTIFHLHLKPEQVSGKIILVGDPARVDAFSSFFSEIEFSIQNREFKTVIGTYSGTRITVISTGIGTDNIDIVLNELDALVNIDLKSRRVKKEHTALEIIRVGTSGGLQHDIPVNSWVISKKSIGFDGLLNFYADRKSVCDIPFEKAFQAHTNWPESLPTPYVVDASKRLYAKVAGDEFHNGVTISAPGFYGPQGRVLRLPLAIPHLNQRIEDFEFDKLKISNFEMESSAIYGLSKMLGHHALTVCLIIANRVTMQANENYRDEMTNLISTILDRITT